MALTITIEVRLACRALVLEAAATHNVPPAYITAHTRRGPADHARREVMRRMISELNLRRWQVAQIFGRDLRRVRRSVLGI